VKHTKQIRHYGESHEKLAEDIGDLYYDSLADFFRLLAAKLKKDGASDKSRGRIKLSNELFACSEKLSEAAQHIDIAWKICEPYVASNDSKK
jgi:hypothetical protein